MSAADTQDVRRQCSEAVHAYFENKTEANLNRLMQAYEPFVASMAYRLSKRLPRHVDYDQLFSDGLHGLYQSVGRFDPSRGYVFATFAGSRIRGAMLDGLRNMMPNARSVTDATGLLSKASEAIRVETGRPPTDAEVRDRLGVSAERYRQMTAVPFRRDYSLDKPIPNDFRKLMTVADLVEANPEPDAGAAEDCRVILDHLLDFYGVREALLFRLRFLEGLTMKQVATALRVSESRISQQLSDLIGCLRSRFNSEGSVA